MRFSFFFLLFILVGIISSPVLATSKMQMDNAMSCCKKETKTENSSPCCPLKNCSKDSICSNLSCGLNIISAQIEETSSGFRFVFFKIKNQLPDYQKIHWKNLSKNIWQPPKVA